MKVARAIETLTVSIASPEFDYERAMQIGAEFCQICGVGAPIFEFGYTEKDGAEGDGHSKYCCKECVIAMLEDMKTYALEVWQRYEAEVHPDDPLSVDLEEHRRRLLQVFGKDSTKRTRQ